jgi:hypothetical protein
MRTRIREDEESRRARRLAAHDADGADGGHAQPAVQGAHADHQRRGQPEARGQRDRPAAGDGLAVDDPITIYINSQGGHVESGDTIHDMVRYVRSPVRMVGTGWVASAGALIYVAVPKERRFSLPHTRYLLHQPAGGMRGSAADIEIEAREILNMRERLNRVFAERTGQTLERIEDDTRRNFWLSAEAPSSTAWSAGSSNVAELD